MGFFDFLKSDKSIENYSVVLAVSKLLLDNHPFPPLNSKGKFELHIFNISSGWNILLNKNMINPTDSLIQSKIIYLIEEGKAYELGISNQDINNLYLKRYEDYFELRKCGIPMLIPYLYSSLYLNPLMLNITATEKLTESKNELASFWKEFLIYNETLNDMVIEGLKRI